MIYGPLKVKREQQRGGPLTTNALSKEEAILKPYKIISNPLESAFIMVFSILDLPTEVIDYIASRLLQEDIPRLALTCERMYNICVGYYHQTVVIASTRFDTNSLPLQKSGIKWMDRLSSDANKRQGIRELIVHGIGVHSMYVHHIPTQRLIHASVSDPSMPRIESFPIHFSPSFERNAWNGTDCNPCFSRR